MDFGVIGGLMLAVGAVLVANAIEGGSVASLVNPSAAVLILGGTLGATAASTGLRGVLSLPRSLVSALRPLPYDNEATAEALVALAVKARREGLLALEDDARAQADPFFARGLQLVVDGADPDMLEGVLLGEAVLARRRREQDARVFETAGGYAPTMGIIGTVMGLIHVLGNLENPSELGPAIAVAFLATFYG
ncbi:MAG: MotA/TolQ/ExbB proton channel family protein, partial [Clostridia bacterium]|nr:MotA/TolQ/ExbB proton channel family protein [Clostridia bacterium]